MLCHHCHHHESLRSRRSWRVTLGVSLVLVLLCSFDTCWASTGLSLDTRALLVANYVPTGLPSYLGVPPTSTGWTVQAWVTWKPGTPSPPRSRILYAKSAINLCVNASTDNFQYSITVLSTGFVRAQVQWCTGGPLVLDSLQPLSAGLEAWTHVTVVFQRQKGIFMYFNGTLENSTPLILPTNDPAVVAFYWDTTSPFNNSGPLTLFDDTGLIDELRYFQKPLGAATVHGNYCARIAPGKLGGRSPTALWDFDSNLSADGVSRVWLDFTFDVDPYGTNDLFHSPPLTPSDLLKTEPPWCTTRSDAQFTTTQLTVLITFVILAGLAIVLWLTCVIGFHMAAQSRESNRAKRSSPALGGVASSLPSASILGGAGRTITARRHAKEP